MWRAGAAWWAAVASCCVGSGCSDDAAIVAAAGATADAVGGDAAVGLLIAADGRGALAGSWAACAAVAKAYCDKLNACYPHPLHALHGTVAHCTERETLRCALLLAAPGADATMTLMSACAAQVKAETCDFIREDQAPICWFGAGQRADGAVCGADSQCQGRYCAIGIGKTCGVCGQVSALGQACVLGQCVAGTRCVFDATQKGYRCRSRESKGGPCNDGFKLESACGWGLSCLAGGTCGAAGAKVGAVCTATGCNHALGLDCSKNDKTCKTIAMGKPGDSCSVAGISSDTYVECLDGACGNQNDMGAGKCAPRVEDGAGCDSWTGPFCRPPARCVDKVCTLPTYGSCG